MKRRILAWAFPVVIVLFAAGSVAVEYPPGVRSAESLLLFLREMAVVIPPALILIALFEAWVPGRTVERHLGAHTGALAHLWALLLAGSTVGGLYVAFPVASALRGKGARLAVVFSYVGLAGIVRIPMTLFEISLLGPRFTLVRYLVGVPLVVVFSELLGRILEARGYSISDPEKSPGRRG